MGLPFPRLPLPRRVLMLGGVVAAIFLMLHTFAPSALPPVLTPGYMHHEPDAPLWSASKWIPPLINGGLPSMPDEFDADGTCRFLSVVEALSSTERALADAMQFTEVSPGVVSVNNASADGAHPILGLLAAGERRWGDLMNRQSKTLQEAYDAYVAKWGRLPPKGFDDWWSYAATREVLLMDEFDMWVWAADLEVWLTTVSWSRSCRSTVCPSRSCRRATPRRRRSSRRLRSLSTAARSRCSGTTTMPVTDGGRRGRAQTPRSMSWRNSSTSCPTSVRPSPSTTSRQ